MISQDQPQEGEAIAQLTRPGHPPPSSPRVGGGGWRVVAGGALALALALGLLDLVRLLQRPLALLLAAIVIASALAPVVARLGRWLPRALAVGIVYLGLLVAVGGIGWAVVPFLLDQAMDLFLNIPALIERARRALARFDRLDSIGLVGTVQSRVGGLTGGLIALPLTVVSSVGEIVLVTVLSAYWLLAAPALEWFTLSLLPRPQRRETRAVLGQIGHTMGGYARAVVLAALSIGGIVYVGLLLIGVDYPLVLALVAGLAELVPLVGPFIGAVPALAVALLDSPAQALIVLVFFIVVQQIEGNLLTPYVLRRQTDIPPLLTLLALLAGGVSGGLLYALVAIPLVGALRVLVLRVVAPALQRWTGAGTGVAADAGEGAA